MKRAYLIPILAIIPLIVISYLLASTLDFESTQVVGLLIVAYVGINIVYSLARKTFHVSIIVELFLVSMLAYFILLYVL